MPAPIPPGYTRGQIIFIGHFEDKETAEVLLQSFWTEAGAFGGRILIVNAADDARTQLAETLFSEWEADSVSRLDITDRRAALDEAHVQTVENATGILLCGDDGLQITRRLGGTLLAQAIRRANARNKIVGGIGAAAGALCQHMLMAGDTVSHDRTYPVQFAPGLGLINRTAVMALHADAGDDIGAQLQAAVQCNPFLIGVALETETAVIVYQDATLDVRGHGRAVILDGADMDDERVTGELGVTTPHTLSAGYGYNLDTHHTRPPAQTDIPTAENHVTSAF